ncbi:hypothetical protein ACVIGB_000643 [Bradyrhizobium sp. USDA 4341]
MLDVSKYPTFVLPTGAQLFHGTDCAGEFLVPDGPAWFAFSRAEAARWAGWSESVPTGRFKGDRRLFAFTTTLDLRLIDTRKIETWQRLCTELCGDPEAGTGTVAQCLREAGLVGWHGRTEVLLSDPAAWLSHCAVFDLGRRVPAGFSP